MYSQLSIILLCQTTFDADLKSAYELCNPPVSWCRLQRSDSPLSVTGTRNITYSLSNNEWFIDATITPIRNQISITIARKPSASATNAVKSVKLDVKSVCSKIDRQFKVTYPCQAPSAPKLSGNFLEYRPKLKGHVVGLGGNSLTITHASSYIASLQLSWGAVFESPNGPLLSKEVLLRKGSSLAQGKNHTGMFVWKKRGPGITSKSPLRLEFEVSSPGGNRPVYLDPTAGQQITRVKSDRRV
jgi:hypothetical protein